jgi:hypothetical protein
MDPAAIGLVRIVFAVAAGVLCGLGPLVAGIRYRQPIVGIAGLCLCTVAGFALGLLLALPLSVLITAGIAYWPAADSKGVAKATGTSPGPMPLVYSLVFGAAAIWCVVSWMLAMFSGFELSLLLIEERHPLSPESAQGETLLVVWWLMRWGVGVFGLFANVLLMLRLKPAIFLGYVTAACETLALLAISRIEFLALCSKPDFGKTIMQLDLLSRLAVRFTPLLIYAAMLVRFHMSSSPPPAKEADGQPGIPSWMSDTRMSTGERE